MGQFIDLSNKRFGRLVAIKRTGTDKNDGCAQWLCRCDCGNMVVERSGDLRYGAVKSCGCTRIEHLRKNPINKTHGNSHTRLYYVWHAMHDRCYYAKSKSYKDYGGRGITVCDEWQSFGPFHDWAMSHGYDPDAPYGKCTIDRIDVDGDYRPDNCRFVDMKCQSNNRRNSKRKKVAA